MRRLIILAAVLAMLAVLLAMNAKTAPAAPRFRDLDPVFGEGSYAEYLTEIGRAHV